MASGWDSVVLQNILNAILGGATFVATATQMNVRLMSASGNSTTNGTQIALTGGSPGYTGGVAVVFGTFGAGNANAGSYGSPQAGAVQDANTAQVQWTGMQACTVAGCELWGGTAPGTARKMWADLTGGSKTVNSGDTFSFAIGALVGQIAG